MHYGQDIFSKDGSSPTITPAYDPHGEMGQRNGFSPLDIWKINKLYSCNPGKNIWCKFALYMCIRVILLFLVKI